MLKLLAATATAGEPGLICFGNEPSWAVHLTNPGAAAPSGLDEPWCSNPEFWI